MDENFIEYNVWKPPSPISFKFHCIIFSSINAHVCQAVFNPDVPDRYSVCVSCLPRVCCMVHAIFNLVTRTTVLRTEHKLLSCLLSSFPKVHTPYSWWHFVFIHAYFMFFQFNVGLRLAAIQISR